MATEDDRHEPPAFVTVPGTSDELTSCTCAEYQAAGYCQHVPQHDALELDQQVRAIEQHAEAIRLLFTLEDDEEKLTALVREMVLVRRGLVPLAPMYKN